MLHNIFRYIILVAPISMLILVSFTFSERLTTSSYIRNIEDIINAAPPSEWKLEEINNQLESLIDEKIVSISPSDKSEFLVINQKIQALESKIDSVSDQTIGLRQAINPVNPDEILKIARLVDELKLLKSEVKSVEKNVVEKQKLFQESILRELKAASDSSTVILAVLLPLVLNFLYTIWKDFRLNGKTEE